MWRKSLKLLTESEVMNLLRVSRTTLWALRRQGKIAHYKVGGSYRYDEDEILKQFRVEIESNSDINFQPKIYRAIDLFAGIGGIRLGFEQAFEDRVRFVYSNDNNKYSCKTYEENFGPISCEDINDVAKNTDQIPDHDILLGGFPCQPFSIAGEKKGFEDKTRGTLFHTVAKILDAKKPSAFLLENVRHFKNHDKGKTWATVKDVLQNDLNYNVFDNVLNAKYFGVPQNRPRFFMIGFKDETVVFNWPKPQKQPPKLRDFLETNVESKYYLGQQYMDSLKKHRKRHEEKGHGFGYKIIDPDTEVAKTLVVGGMGRERNLIKNHPLPDCWKPGDDPLKTKNNEGIRRLTPREFARLQGFPDSYKIPVSETQAYKQFANSVAVPVIKEIAKSMLAALESKVFRPTIVSYT